MQQNFHVAMRHLHELFVTSFQPIALFESVYGIGNQGEWRPELVTHIGEEAQFCVRRLLRQAVL